MVVHPNQLEDERVKALFAAMILEIIVAGFFLFNEYKNFEPQNISYVPREVYPFDAKGEPVNLEIFQGDRLAKKFDKIPDYKDIPREAKIENNKLYFTTKKEKVYLGCIDEVREKLAHEFLTPETALHLGLYLSEVQNGTRKDPHQAVKYLFQVLRAGSEGEDSDKEEAVMRLHELLSYIEKFDDFKLLLRMIDKYRSGHNKYFELAETYLFYALLSDKNSRQEKNKIALKYYLLFLSTPASEKKALKALKDTAIDRLKELVKIDAVEDESIRAKRYIILADVYNHDRAALLNHSQNISVPELSELD